MCDCDFVLILFCY